MLKLAFNLSLVAFTVLLFFSFSAGKTLAAIDCSNPATTADAIKCGSNDAAGQPANAQPSNIDHTIKQIVNILSVVVGVVAVVMIILAGFRYITSGGASDQVASAKNALIYAIIGLVIVALAQVIARFVLTRVTK